MLRYIYVLLLIMLIQSGPASAGVIHFVNGDRITGEVVQSGQSHATIMTEFGELKVPNELIKPQDPLPEITEAEVAAANQPQPGAAREWRGHVELNSSFSRGNTNSQLINLNADYMLERERHRYEADISSIREEKDSDRIKEQDRLNLGYHYLYSNKFFFAMNATIEQDPVALLEHRVSLNPGAGYDIWNEDGRKLNVQLGAGYSTERTDGADESSALVDWRLNYSQDIFDGAMEVFHKHKIYRNLQGRRNTVFNSQSGVRYDLNDSLYMNVQLNYDYDTEPAQNTDTEDLTFMVGAGMTL